MGGGYRQYNVYMRTSGRFVSLFLVLTAFPVFAAAPGPSRAALKGCAWRKLADEKVGLEAWVQDCDFGFRKIDFRFSGSSLLLRYSDGGGSSGPVVSVFDLEPKETPEAGISRIFASRTKKSTASRCVLAPYRGERAPPGVKRFTFVPKAAYQKELDSKADPNEVPEPPCGDFGTTPDGIQYFEAHPKSGARRVLFVRVGQDEPLFDEKTLRILR
jgi:hypothetical protein